MKTIKLTLATCAVALSTALIWTACQKEELNSTIQESSFEAKRGKPEQPKHYTFKALSHALKADFNANIIDNGRGTVTVSTQILNTSENNPKQLVIDASESIVDNDGTITIPEEGKFWLIRVGENNNPIERIAPGSSGAFKCKCTTTGEVGESSGCKVLVIRQLGSTILDCTVADPAKCDGSCSGISVNPTTHSSPIDVGEIIINADKVIFNGKIFE